MDNLKQEFSAIYDQYIEKIYRFIYLKVSSEAIAQDLTSEAFLRFWKSYQKKGSDIDNISAFLYRIAHNLIVDHYRRKGKIKIVSTENRVIADLSVDLEQKAFLSSDVSNVRFALSNLSEDYQNVIIWRYLDDFSTAEVAQMMNKSEEATRVLLHRALKALRTTINEA